MSTPKSQNCHAMRLRQIAGWEGDGPLSLILTDAADELDRLTADLQRVSEELEKKVTR